MKFLSELRSCFVPARIPVKSQAEDGGGSTPPLVSGTVPAGKSDPSRRRWTPRVSEQWRPALPMVAEDSMSLVKDRNDVVQRTVDRSKKKKRSRKGRPRSIFLGLDEFRKPSMPMMSSATAPMALMF